MIEVHLARPHAPDKHLGHVSEEGRVYHADLGPDREFGHVDLATGRVFESHLGPDVEVGHVDLADGRCYIAKGGPDAYVGRVDGSGRMHRHRRLAPDENVGWAEPFLGFAHAGAALLLLVWPQLQAEAARQAPSEPPESDGPEPDAPEADASEPAGTP